MLQSVFVLGIDSVSLNGDGGGDGGLNKVHYRSLWQAELSQPPQEVLTLFMLGG